MLVSQWLRRLAQQWSLHDDSMRRRVRVPMRRRVRPRLEALEDRTLPSATLPVSVDPTGTTTGNASATLAPGSVSANGEYSVFVSGATNLANGVTIQANSGNHVYLRNLSTGTTTMVDVDMTNGNQSSNGAAFGASITPDGRYIAFVSSSTDLTNNDSSASDPQVYVRDMQSGQTFLVTLGTDGKPENGQAFITPTPTIAEDGNGNLLIAFESNATNLTQGDTSNAHQQIFLTAFKLDSSGNVQYTSLQTTLVTPDTSGTGSGGNDDSANPIFSTDGSSLVFNSRASNLNVPGGYSDNNPGANQVYVYSVGTQTLHLLSAEPTTAATGNAASDLALQVEPNGTFHSLYQESVSGNGQYVVFFSAADNLVPNLPTNGNTNVYLRDLKAGTTSMVSISSDGKSGTDVAGQAALTPDGRYVAFIGESSSLTSNGDNNPQVYVRDMQQGQTYLVSLGTDAKAANNNGVSASDHISIAENSSGQLVIAYASQATNLTSKDTNATNAQVFVTTLNLDASGNIQYNTLSTTLASADSSGNGGNGNSGAPILSKDGSTLAFQSLAQNLPGETADADSLGNPHVQIFTYTLATNTLTQVSSTPAAGSVADSLALSSISDNGQFLTYYSIVNNSGGTATIEGWNGSTKTNTSIAAAAGDSSPVISGDGNTIISLVNGNVFAYTNWQGGSPTITSVATGSSGSGTQVSLSDNGQFIAYNLEQLPSGLNQVFLYNTATGKTTLASPSTGGGDSDGTTSYAPEISSDGSIIVYASTADDLVANIADLATGGDNLFAYNLADSTVSVVSAKAPGLFTGNSTASSFSVSDNGRYVAFQSYASDLVGGLRGYGEVYVEDMQKSVLNLITLSASGAVDTSGSSVNPVISGDGSTVAFASTAIDLTNQTLGGNQVYSRNWLATNPTNTLVSVNSSGTGGGSNAGNADLPSISDNGQIIAFQSSDNDLTGNDPNAKGFTQIFVRDMGTNTTLLASSNSAGTDGGGDNSTAPLLSADGSTVYYNSSATDLVSGVSPSKDAKGDAIEPNIYAFLRNSSAPAITTQPKSLTVQAGQTATFTAAASGTPPPVVQWQVSTDGGKTFTNISGATSDTLTLSNVTAAQNDVLYQAVYTNTFGTATTSKATLTVQFAPAVTTNPSDQTVTAGQNATFTAAANANPAATVQWQVSTDGGKTFTNISGATNTTLTLNAVTTAMSGNEYQAVFTNSIGSATTSAAALTVQLAPSVTTNPSTQTLKAGQTATFTAAANGNPTPTVQWQVSSDGGKTFTNISGATNDTLTLNPVTADMNGDEYQAVFTNNIGTATTKVSTLTVQFAAIVTTNPKTQTVTAGQNATFTAAANANPAATVQWQVSSDGGKTFTNVSGATNTTLTLNAVTAAMNGNEYQAIFTNSIGSTNTTTAALNVQFKPSVTVNPSDQTVAAGQTVTFAAAASGNPTPTVQWQVSSDGGKTFTNISGATNNTLTLTNVQSSKNGFEYQAVFTNSIGTTTTTAALLTVQTVPAITSGTSATFTVGQGGSFTVTATGSPAPSLTEAGALPKGVSFTNNGNGTATLNGTPAAGINGTFQFTITAQNAAGSVTQSFTLTVKPAPVPPPSPPSLNVPPLLAFINALFGGGTESMNVNGTRTITDSILGIPLFVSTFDSSGNLASVTFLGIDITFVFSLL